MTQASFKGAQINRSLAEQIAQAMKVWALEKGATLYPLVSTLLVQQQKSTSLF